MHLPSARLFALTVVTLHFAQAASAQTLWHSDLNAARKVAMETNRPILCHFGAEWCGPCQLMEREVFPTQQVREKLGSSVVGVKIDVNERPDLARRFGVHQFPTDLFLEPNGSQLLRTTGFKSTGEYVSLMMRANTRYSDLLAQRQPKPSTSPEIAADQSESTIRPAGQQSVMLDGYCPVTLWKTRRWEKGNSRWQVEYKGQVFHMASEQERDDFRLTPDRYAPQFLGCDPVIAWETDRAVPGDTRFGAFYDEQLYLFSSNDNRTRFKSEPDRYVQAEVVLNVDQIERVVK
ncbi:thioredoxin family protein [Thalassoglobus sp. JC818]|uniref:thioredoxin family protein n=1 Tax=Thalassoglobus sp. JC818 TaxID=3232136 RepID=UPI003457CFDB